MLRGNQVPRKITDWSPIVLSVANDAAGQQILEIRSFEESPSSQNDDDDLECCVCHGEDNDEPVMLQCRSCSFHVLLDCMEKWLELRRSGQHPSCPQCRSQGAFDALFRGARDVSVATETAASERAPHERGSGTSTPVSPSHSGSQVSLGGSPSPTPRAAAHGMDFHDELRRYGGRRSARLAHRPDPFRVTQSGTARRSARLAQRNGQQLERDC
ncbi:hypothetical protein DTO027I6_9852 [Penicillium roqueforti]|nr:hypothetical protein CBS147337_9906 [Penicillium roqueforti]KAI3185248.1 hypothetical protein DTO027I6_9852 [Penicillium roqueforti]